MENQQRANIAMLETIRSTLSLRAVTRRPLTRRLSLCGTALAMLIFPSLLGAQTVDSAKLLRFDVSALVGYRTSISFSSQPSSGEVSSNLLLDPSLSYGIAFGARIDEDNLVEFRWARQRTICTRAAQSLSRFLKQQCLINFISTSRMNMRSKVGR